MKEIACEILDISEKIYRIQETNNPTAVFKDKVFVIGSESDRNSISIEKDSEKKDSSYYFQTSDINGVIVRRENGNYSVKAAVKYSDGSNDDLWFAKIRIEPSYDGNIKIMGSWGGSWQKKDFEDEDLLTSNNKELPFALDSMKEHLMGIYNWKRLEKIQK